MINTINYFFIIAQLQETRDTPYVDLYYGTDIMIKLGSTDNQNASGMLIESILIMLIERLLVL